MCYQSMPEHPVSLVLQVKEGQTSDQELGRHIPTEKKKQNKTVHSNAGAGPSCPRTPKRTHRGTTE